MKFFVLLWALLASVTLAAFLPEQRYVPSKSEEFPESIQSYVKTAQAFLKEPFNPNSSIHWSVLFHRNKITILDTFTKLESLLTDFLSGERDTLYDYFLGRKLIPDWFNMFFWAAVYHYFSFKFRRHSQIDRFLLDMKFYNCVKFYSDNKNSK